MGRSSGAVAGENSVLVIGDANDKAAGVIGCECVIGGLANIFPSVMGGGCLEDLTRGCNIDALMAQ
jgi:hypothetical protein